MMPTTYTEIPKQIYAGVNIRNDINIPAIKQVILMEERPWRIPLGFSYSN